MSATSQAPRAALIISAAPVAWSSGEAFDGYIALLLALPEFSGTPTVTMNAGDSLSVQVIPTRIMIPINGGVIDNSTRVLLNPDMQPPNSKYVAYWLDPQLRTVATDSALFSITDTTYTISVPTLTSPAATIVVPVLQP